MSRILGGLFSVFRAVFECKICIFWAQFAIFEHKIFDFHFRSAEFWSVSVLLSQSFNHHGVIAFIMFGGRNMMEFTGFQVWKKWTFSQNPFHRSPQFYIVLVDHNVTLKKSSSHKHQDATFLSVPKHICSIGWFAIQLPLCGETRIPASLSQPAQKISHNMGPIGAKFSRRYSWKSQPNVSKFLLNFLPNGPH